MASTLAAIPVLGVDPVNPGQRAYRSAKAMPQRTTITDIALKAAKPPTTGSLNGLYVIVENTDITGIGKHAVSTAA